MDINELKSRIKDGRLSGCFILAGEEDYLKRYYLAKIREAIVDDGAFATFNHAVYDGADVDFSSIRDDVTSPPMMADKKLIEWRYPNFEKMKESDLKLLEETVELLNEYDYATLVFLVAEDGLTLGTAKRESLRLKSSTLSGELLETKATEIPFSAKLFKKEISFSSGSGVS